MSIQDWSTAPLVLIRVSEDGTTLQPIIYSPQVTGDKQDIPRLLSQIYTIVYIPVKYYCEYIF